MSFPKLPGGPIPQGSAAVRGLETTGAKYQTKQGVDYTARVKDAFSRVEGGEDKFMTSGQMLVTEGFRGRATRDFYAPAKYSSATISTNCDFGLYAYLKNIADANVFTSGSYPGAYASAPTIGANFAFYKTTNQFCFGRTPRNVTPVAEIATYSQQPVGPYLALYRVRPIYLYGGRVDKGQGNEARVVSVFNAKLGRVDSVGRELLDPVITYVYEKSNVEAFLIPMPTGQRDYCDPTIVVSSQHMYMLVPERFYQYGAVSPSVDVRPPFWHFYSSDGGATWLRQDIRSIALNDLDIPKQRVAKYTAGGGPEGASGFFLSDTIPLDDGKPNIIDTVTYSHIQDYAVSTGPLVVGTRELYPFLLSDGYQLNANLSFVIGAGQWVMCENHTALYSFPYRKTVDGSYVWASKIIRMQGTTVTVVYTSPTTSASTEYIESMVYVGDNVVLAKKVKGFGGINFDVTFLRSNDNGGTWTEFTPTGFGAPLKNQYYGNFAVAAPRINNSDKPGRLLITSWDMATQSYYLFSTIDVGATWKKGGKIGTPDAFRRIDGMLSGDGGLNFANIDPINAQLRRYTVDPALPTRYVRNP